MLLFELFDPLLNCWTLLLLFFRLLNCICKHVIDRVNDRWLLRHSHRPPLLFVSLPPEHLFFGLVNVECLTLELPIWSKEQLHLLGLLLSVLLFNTLRRPLDVNAHLQITAQLRITIRLLHHLSAAFRFFLLFELKLSRASEQVFVKLRSSLAFPLFSIVTVVVERRYLDIIVSPELVATQEIDGRDPTRPIAEVKRLSHHILTIVVIVLNDSLCASRFDNIIVTLCSHHHQGGSSHQCLIVCPMHNCILSRLETIAIVRSP